MLLLHLPPEMIKTVAEYLTRKQDLNALAQTSQDLYQIVNPLLYIEALRTHGIAITFWAAFNGRMSTIQRFLAHGATNLDHSVHGGCTLLHIACSNNQLLLVQILVESGADIAATDPYGETPFEKAAESGCLAIVKYLLPHLKKHHPDSYLEQMGNAVRLSICFECTAVVEFLFSQAATLGHDGVVTFLLSKGVDPNYKIQAEQRSAITYAGMYGRLQTAKVLLAAGANINDPDACGHTPILYAELGGHRTVLDAYKQHDPESYAAYMHAQYENRVHMQTEEPPWTPWEETEYISLQEL
ncbi:ankyrin [Aspergillus sclerotiicarbonarius CBS 121057]|uniref:Ankyrin n=1 Tax=Aspergillus sclerotiicarbonarius (strain CBS 121057 / IBT 28362) TaxID=1448318 RepID=A0A319E3Z8_ASPSB|nr:ankyrin [Aspergillus sclerotiicarbonarius CBS 121057]